MVGFSRPAPKPLLLGLVIFLVAGAGALTQSTPTLARERGAAGSDARALWCRSQLSSCVTNGYAECDRRYPDDTVRASACYNGATDACLGTYGETSNCRTLARPVVPVLPTRPAERAR